MRFPGTAACSRCGTLNISGRGSSKPLEPLEENLPLWNLVPRPRCPRTHEAAPSGPSSSLHVWQGSMAVSGCSRPRMPVLAPLPLPQFSGGPRAVCSSVRWDPGKRMNEKVAGQGAMLGGHCCDSRHTRALTDSESVAWFILQKCRGAKAEVPSPQHRAPGWGVFL